MSNKRTRTNKHGESCENFHSTSSSKEEQFNKECPACFSDEGELYMMSCMHRMHSECAKHLISTECPLCRETVSNFHDNVIQSIAENEKIFQRDLEIEDREMLLNRERQIDTILGGLLSAQTPSQIEVISAMQFLRNEGIPLSYIPTNIHISVPRDLPRLSPGTLFYAIVGHVMEKINQDLQFGNAEEPEPFDHEEDNDDEENPFEWEDENLSILSRSVQVRNS